MDVVQYALKQSKFLLNAGHTDEAAIQAHWAWMSASLNSRFAHLLPITEHRRAMVFKTFGQSENARRCFKHAEATFDPTNIIGLSILERDYGFFLIEQGDSVKGRHRLETALQYLTQASIIGERVDLEARVCEGFLARANLLQGYMPDKALRQLKEIDEALRRWPTKPGYQLDNLLWILRYEVNPFEHAKFLPRAIFLAVRLGNLSLALKLGTLSTASQLARFSYRRIF